MSDYKLASSHVTTYYMSDADFQKIKLEDIPKGWEYNQTESTNGTRHTFKSKWNIDFFKDIWPGIKKDEKKNVLLSKSSWVIEDQTRQKVAFAQKMGVVGNSAESKFLQKKAELLVQRGHAKNIKAALEMIS